DAQLAQFLVDPRSSPEGIRVAHLVKGVRMAAAVLGRPGRVGVERWVQRRRSHWRCQRTTVSGCTTIKAVRQSRQALASSTQNSRSLAKVRTPGRAPQDGHLLTQRQVLERDGSVSTTEQPERSKHYNKRGQHALS